MKKLVLVIGLMLLTPLITIESPNLTFTSNYIEFKTTAKFYPTYHKIRKFEGNYVFTLYDKGKETYGGVTRRYNKDWYGWKYIDQYKKKNKGIKRYTKVEEAEYWVLDYYLDIWVKEEFYRLKHQNVADYVFDYRVNAYTGPKNIQQVLISLGKEINVTNRIDSYTINAINEVDPTLFLIELRNVRIAHYKGIVERDTTQGRFLNHWLIRAKDIKI